MNTSSKIKLGLAALLITFASCSKEGSVGPQGAQGEQGIEGKKGDKGDKGDKGNKGDTGARGARGAKGDRGDKGEKGDKGDKGTANVVASGWIDYEINSTPNTSTYKTMKYTFPAHVLSQIGAEDIAHFLFEGGLLILYGKNYGNGQNNMLPYEYYNVSYTWSGGSFGVSTINAINIRIRSTDGSALTEYDYSGFRGNEFRYVLIPAGIQLSGMRSPSDIDWSALSYQQVKSVLNLGD